MAELNLRNLLGQSALKLKKELEGLELPVSAGPLEVQGWEASGSTALDLFDQTVGLDTEAEFAVEASISAIDAGAPGFAPAEPWQPKPGEALTEVAINAAVGLSGSGSLKKAQPLSLALGFKANSRLQYRHLISVAATQPRQKALTAVVASSSLPQLVRLERLSEGELHELGVKAYLGSEVKLSAGGELDASVKLDELWEVFEGLSSAPVKLHARYTLEASLKAGLYERLRLVAGRPVGEEWIRLRVEREDQRRLTLGAKLAVQAEYDLGSALVSVFDSILAEPALQRARAALGELAVVAEGISEANWEALKARLSQEAKERVHDFLGSQEWLTGALDSEPIQKLLGWSKQLVDFYDGLDERIADLFERAVSRGQVDRLRKLLSELQNVPTEAADLLTENQKEYVQLVEVLSGWSLEELLLDATDTPRQILEEMKARVARAVERIDGFPTDLTERLKALAEEAGIERLVEWLRTHATVEDIKSLAEDFTERAVARAIESLIDKPLSKVDGTDVKEVKQFAERAEKILKTPGEYEKKIRAYLQKLNGKVGFSIGIEIDRLTRSAAVLDLDIDPGISTRVRTAWAAGDIEGILSNLPDEPEDKNDPDSWQFRLRDCFLTTYRSRSASSEVFLSVFGLSSAKRWRISESAVRVVPVDGGFRRLARYAGGQLLTTRSTDGLSMSSGTWVIFKAEGPGIDLTAAFAESSSELRLTAGRNDQKLTSAERAATAALLAQLGAIPSSASVEEDLAVVRDGAETRLAIDLRLTATALASFLSDLHDLSAWNYDYANASYRWLNEELEPQFADTTPSGVPLGTALSRMFHLQDFLRAWLKGRTELDLFGRTHRVISNLTWRGREFDLNLTRQAPAGDVLWKQHWALTETQFQRTAGLKALKRAGALLPAVRPRDLEAVAGAMADAFTASSPWLSFGSPMFNLWLVVARLSRNPGVFEGGRGLASLRYRDTDGEWQGITFSCNPTGLAKPRGTGTGVFPLVP
jgi:hypothetical protein